VIEIGKMNDSFDDVIRRVLQENKTLREENEKLREENERLQGIRKKRRETS